MAQWNKSTQDYLNQERTLHEVIMCADRYGNIGNCGVAGTGAVGGDAFGRMRISQPLLYLIVLTDIKTIIFGRV